MKAMQLTGIRQLEPAEVPEPEMTRDDDVLVRVDMVGVCGSDVHYYTTGRIGSQVVEFPWIVGHECAGTVLETGPAVSGLEPGTRVAIDPAVPCHDCDQCRMGRMHTCRRLSFLGCPGQAPGCLVERIVMPAECCLPLAEGMTTERGVLSEPLAIGVYGVRQSVPMTGARVGVLGCGPIGLSVLAAARAEGASRIYCTDRIDRRLDAAQAAGAAWTGNPDREDVVAAIAREEPDLLDCVFECAGQQETVDQAFGMLRPGGTLMIIGIPEFDRFSFPADVGRRKEITLRHVRRQNECTGPTLAMLADGTIDVDAMVTHRFPFAEAKAGFDLVDQYADGVIKAMIVMGE